MVPENDLFETWELVLHLFGLFSFKIRCFKFADKKKKVDLAVLFLKQGPSPWRRLKQQKLEPLAFPVNRLWTSDRIV